MVLDIEKFIPEDKNPFKVIKEFQYHFKINLIFSKFNVVEMSVAVHKAERSGAELVLIGVVPS